MENVQHFENYYCANCTLFSEFLKCEQNYVKKIGRFFICPFILNSKKSFSPSVTIAIDTGLINLGETLRGAGDEKCYGANCTPMHFFPNF